MQVLGIIECPVESHLLFGEGEERFGNHAFRSHACVETRVGHVGAGMMP